MEIHPSVHPSVHPSLPSPQAARWLRTVLLPLAPLPLPLGFSLLRLPEPRWLQPLLAPSFPPGRSPAGAAPASGQAEGLGASRLSGICLCGSGRSCGYPGGSHRLVGGDRKGVEALPGNGVTCNQPPEGVGLWSPTPAPPGLFLILCVPGSPSLGSSMGRPPR